MILFIAFPMHLAVEFCRALFHRIENASERTPRLIYYGIPLFLIVSLGIWLKWSLYAAHDGMRAFLWNYLEFGPSRLFFIVALVIGLALLLPWVVVVRWREPAASEGLG